MDSRRVSAALGFALLIGCVIGIVILIHNSGTSRRSSFPQMNTGASDGGKEQRHYHHAFVNGKRENGFVNDPNYRSSQPTMQEMNELADELHRFLSPKSKPVEDNLVNGTTMSKQLLKKKNNGSLLMLDQHKPFPRPLATSTVTGIKKASISAVNYSNLPGTNNPPRPHGSPNIAPPHPNYQQHPNHNQLNPEIIHHQPNHRPIVPATAGGKLNIVDVGEQGGYGRERGGLYNAPWLPSMPPPSSASPGVHLSSPHLNATNPILHQHHPRQRQPPPQLHHAPPKYPPRQNHYHINDHRRMRPPPPPHINGNHRVNIPFLPPIVGINGTRHPQRNRFGHSSTLGQLDMIEDTFDDLSEEEYNEDFVETSGQHHENRAHADRSNAVDSESDAGDDVEWEEDEEEANDQDPTNKAGGGDLEPKDFVADFQTLFQLANHLYTSPANNNSGTLFQGFLKVINETIERGSDMRLLAELNEMYEGRLGKDGQITNSSSSPKLDNKSSTSSGSTDMLKYQQQQQQHDNKKMGPNETSLTAFIFMSFGVFLLNQIHSFVQKSGLSLGAPDGAKGNVTEEASPALGRALLGQDFFDWYIEPLSVAEDGSSSVSSLFLGREPSSLDILFEEPKDSRLIPNDTTSSTPDPHEEEWQGRSVNDMDDNSFSSSQHVNNMFRALLNIVNAYTKNSEVMECIWSLYCQDLDNTAGKRGLYGVAARINSVGLRLIMNQIPPSLAFDVILRSLVGWDGLPCSKMFPPCAVNNGTILPVEDVAADGGEKTAK